MTTEAEARLNQHLKNIEEAKGVIIPKTCPNCKSELIFQKDESLEEYHCTNPNCNYKFNPKKEAWKKSIKQMYKQENDFLENPELMRTIFNDLSRRVKHDNVTKSAVLVSGISAYLPEPLNLFEKGQSGSGKTYNAIETLAYFPQEDIWYLSGMSPKALVHQKGVLLDKDGEVIDLNEKPNRPKKSQYRNREEEYNKDYREYQENIVQFNERLKDSYNYINIENKIFVFLETPNGETMRMLFPILSHDKRRVEYRFVNKGSSGNLRTDKVVVEGYPSAIFLTTDRQYVEELATRSFTVSPESCEEKIESANELTNLKASLPWECTKETSSFVMTKTLIENIRKILSDNKLDVILPFLELHEIFPKSASRDMRDFSHFTQFVKAWTIFHIHQRPCLERYEKKYVLSNSYDVVCCHKIFKDLIETTRTGTEKRILDFYKTYMMNSDSGFNVSDLTTKYNEESKTKLSDYTIRNWLNRLNEIGYVEKTEDSSDKRKYFYKPLLKNAEILENVGKIENPEDLLFKIEKGFKLWKKNIGSNNDILLKEKINSESEISLDDLERIILVNKKNVLSYSENVFNDYNKPELTSDSKNNPKKSLKMENQTFSTNSKGFIEQVEETPLPLKKNEVVYKGKKEAVKFPKRWYMEDDQ
ncbi:MAG: hypothetical protein JW702_07995 [Clostridiales bacterium]|nr:hypothetical protein [Clostridiales bacterium]